MGKKPQQKLEKSSNINPEVIKSIWGIVFVSACIVVALAFFKKAGPAGEIIFKGLFFLFGYGYWMIVTILGILGIRFLLPEKKGLVTASIIGASAVVVFGISLLDMIFPQKIGFMGNILGMMEIPFGYIAGIIVNIAIILVGAMVTLNMAFTLKIPSIFNIFKKIADTKDEKEMLSPAEEANIKKASEDTKPTAPIDQNKGHLSLSVNEMVLGENTSKPIKKVSFKNYVPPPLSLLNSQSEKPTAGDLKGNANIIKRTLESFGIPVEMGEITVGPKVTRFTLKPAEGIKLSRIVALNQDLALSLAAHPLRIEAPIPGLSLVGIEVPNKTAAIVRLGSILGAPEFQNSHALSFGLGREISGEPIFPNIGKMPHLLVAGATGSGKSVTIHSIITSLLFRNSPETLKFIMVDPKRVELSVYNKIPHMITPVITDGKKAVSALRWAISEMDRRYDVLLEEGFRDIDGFNSKHRSEPMPYLIIVIDELADLMAQYGREVEGSIVRLAQMARAVGIHLIVSTQRPSVEVITGLIKANITTRIALQVASQIDSRTILDTAGAEKLLGGGDMLLVSAELSKPKRIQGTYLTEDEIKTVTEFIAKNNEPELQEASVTSQNPIEGILSMPTGDDDDDDMLPEAVETVKEAGKASASLLQRRLKVGYARAARLLDIMESKGFIGPGDGAKPREVYLKHEEDTE